MAAAGWRALAGSSLPACPQGGWHALWGVPQPHSSGGRHRNGRGRGQAPREIPSKPLVLSLLLLGPHLVAAAPAPRHPSPLAKGLAGGEDPHSQSEPCTPPVNPIWLLSWQGTSLRENTQPSTPRAQLLYDNTRSAAPESRGPRAKESSRDQGHFWSLTGAGQDRTGRNRENCLFWRFLFI